MGDKRCDIECGRAVGLRTVLVETGLPEERPDPAVARPDHRARDLGDAVAWILQERSQRVGSIRADGIDRAEKGDRPSS